jgi:quercetin dioxygenase-like cupin family protein
MSDDRRSQDEANPQPASNTADAAFSALALSLDPVEPPAEVRARLLAALHTHERFTLFASDVAREFGLSSEAALAALRAIDDASAWHSGAGPGSGWLITPALRAARVVIARLPPNSVIRRHSHAHRELTFVLDGLLIEDGAKRCGPGTLLAPAIGTDHELSVGGDEPCTVVFHPAPLA